MFTPFAGGTFFFFDFLYVVFQQTKLLDAMAPDGQYPADAVAEGQARLRRTLERLLERARQPLRPQELAAYDAQLARAERRHRDLTQQRQQALADAQAHAAAAAQAEQRVALAEREAALAAEHARSAAAAAAEAEAAAAKPKAAAAGKLAAQKRSAAKVAARKAARLEGEAEALRAALARQRADRDRHARRAAALPQKIAAAATAIEELRRRIAERDEDDAAGAWQRATPSGKSGNGGAATDKADGGSGKVVKSNDASGVVAAGNGRDKGTDERSRSARRVGGSGDGTSASEGPAGLLRPVMQVGEAAREKWRQVAEFGPVMLLDSIGVRARPQGQLRRGPMRLSSPAAAFRARLPIRR